MPITVPGAHRLSDDQSDRKGVWSTCEHVQLEPDFTAAVYSAVQAASIDGMLLVDSHEKIVSFNRRFVDIWNIPPELIAGRSDAPVLELVAGQVMDRVGFVARVGQLYAQIDETSRDEILLKDGRTLDRYSAPVRLDDGTYLGRVWFFRDTTEHKQAVDKIREDASQFQALIEQQLAGIFIIRGDGILSYINPRFSALFGYTPVEVIGRPFLDLVADGDKDALRKSFAEHLEEGPPATQTVTAIKRKDGGLMDVLAHASIASYQGKPALAGILIDITERQRATALLKASEERFRLLVEQAPDAIVLYDADADRFVSANKRATTLFGCSREDLLKLRPLDFFVADSAGEHGLSASVEEHTRQALAGVDCVFERRFRNTQGREGICEVRLVRLPTVVGHMLRGSLIDITERRQAEQALAHRDRIVQAMSISIADLVAAPSLAAGMLRALQTAAEALHVDRILILKRSPAAAPITDVSMVHAWMATDAPKLEPNSFSGASRDSQQLADWLAPLWHGKPVITDVATAPGAIGEIMRQMQNISSLMVPISVAGQYWGHIRLDDCKSERQWTPIERNMLGTWSQAIGALMMREQAQTSLQFSEERFRAVSDTSQDAIIIVDSAARVTYWNRAAESIFGYVASEVVGSSAYGYLVPPRYRRTAMAAMREFAVTGGGSVVGNTRELVAMRKDGTEFPIELSVAGVLLAGEWHAVATIRDITERKRIVEQIRHAARHDGLTGLANRTVFVEALQQAIARAQRGGDNFAVLYLDLDHFKDVNDTLGHPAGDLVLQIVAERLRRSVRDMDTVARFGGDEFALIQAGISGPLDAAALADKLLEAISLPAAIQDSEIRSGASVGIAVYGLDSVTAETLLSHADVALYRAKLEGRGTYRFFTDAMDLEVRTRVTLGAELRDAVAAGQMFLEYQPQIDVDTGSFVGVEALVRWRHPKRGVLLPDIFIPVAEQSGLIVSLGRWILHESCRQMQQWTEEGIAPPLIAVNVSGLQFKTPCEMERYIAEILTETALPAQRLELEITETVLMEVSREHNDALLRLRKAGHRIAIDDFGTGYSSLEYLSRFPVDRIKIAQTFIADLTSASTNATIVRAAIALGHELKLDVVVEGVETAEQIGQLRSWGCRKVQGYYFSKPLLPGELAPLLRLGRILRARPVPAQAAVE